MPIEQAPGLVIVAAGVAPRQQLPQGIPVQAEMIPQGQQGQGKQAQGQGETREGAEPAWPAIDSIQQQASGERDGRQRIVGDEEQFSWQEAMQKDTIDNKRQKETSY